MLSPLTPELATRLVGENEGRTLEEIIGEAIDGGVIGGTLQGQKGAFTKHFVEGRLPDVRREGRPYRYYLKSTVPRESPGKGVGLALQSISFRPTSEQEEILNALLETRKFSNRSEAVQWLLKEGIAAKRAEIKSVLDAYRQIEELRQQIQRTVS